MEGLGPRWLVLVLSQSAGLYFFIIFTFLVVYHS